MSLETETILDRRRLKRQTALWRILAVLAVVTAIGAIFASSEDGFGLTDSRQIARVTIEGMITEDREQLQLLKKVAEAKSVSGVILFVNSPGGTTAGGEALFEALRRIAERKPIVAQFGTVAASAAYIAGLGTDHIVARGNTITGSVGVIVQWPEVSELLAKLGVRMNEIKSGPLKANPSTFQPLDEAGREATRAMIADGQRWFLGLVAQRRGVSTDAVPGLEQGRVFSGREALTFKLVDEIGGEVEAVRWLEEKRNVRKGLRIIDWRPRRAGDWSVVGALSQLAATVLGKPLADLIGLASGQAGLVSIGLDGLLSVWQPHKN